MTFMCNFKGLPKHSAFLFLPSMPLARSLSVTSLSGLEEWDEEFDLESAVLFEIAWEVANKGKCFCLCVLSSCIFVCTSMYVLSVFICLHWLSSLFAKVILRREIVVVRDLYCLTHSVLGWIIFYLCLDFLCVHLSCLLHVQSWRHLHGHPDQSSPDLRGMGGELFPGGSLRGEQCAHSGGADRAHQPCAEENLW